MVKLERRLDDGGETTQYPTIASWVAALELELMGPQEGDEFAEFASLQGMQKLDAYMHQLERVKLPMMEALLDCDPIGIMSLASLSVRLYEIELLCFATNPVSPFYERFARASRSLLD